jgi:hypothetical protein
MRASISVRACGHSSNGSAPARASSMSRFRARDGGDAPFQLGDVLAQPVAVVHRVAGGQQLAHLPQAESGLRPMLARCTVSVHKTCAQKLCTLA